MAEKALATHSSTLAWKLPWTEEPGRLQSMGSLESDTTERLHFHFSLSCIGGGNGSPLQCSCLENPRDGEAWWAAVYGVAQSRTRLKWRSSSKPMLCDPMNCSMPDFPVHHHLSEFAQTHFHWVGDAIQPSHPLSPHSLPSFSLSQKQVFSNGLALLIRWPKYWSYSFSISPSNEYSGLISFRID